jgi:hypothetical protein
LVQIGATFHKDEVNSNLVIQEVGRKLVREQVLFFISAGLSSNWGYFTSRQWTRHILKKCANILPEAMHREILNAVGVDINKCDEYEADLGLLTEVLEYEFEKCPTLGAILGFGLADPHEREPWLTRDEARELLLRGVEVIGIPHIVLARLAREKLITEVITTNYDVLLETACWATGMDDEEDSRECCRYVGIPAVYRVIAGSLEYYASRTQQNVFRIYKIHGCAHKTITAFAARRSGAAECSACPRLKGEKAKCCRKEIMEKRDDLNLVLTRRELQHWRRDDWAKDLLCDRVRNHNMVFISFSGADQVLNVTLRNVFAEIRAKLKKRKLLGDRLSVGAKDSAGTFSIRRAYAIDISLGPDLAAILRDSNISVGRSRAPVRPFGQFIKIETNSDGGDCVDKGEKKMETKASVESIFKNIYITAIHELLETLIEDRGIGTVLLQDGTLTERQAEEILGTIKGFLQNAVKDYPQFIFDTLPGAVTASWLYGANVGETYRRSAMFILAGRPHFYIPLRHNLEITLSLLRFYSLLPMGISFHTYGWVEVLKPVDMPYPAYALLPLYRPRPENLLWLRYWLERSKETFAAGRQRVIVILGYPPEGSQWSEDRRSVSAGCWVVPVPSDVFWRPSTKDIWECIASELRRRRQEEGWPYGVCG